MNAQISVIICSYNPDPNVFPRCLNAVDLAQKSASTEAEVIIVDNNSVPALQEMDCVQQFLANGANRVLLQEPRPGKTNAILKALEIAKGDAIVINDDDNLPQPDYLSEAATLLREYPWVGAWGPGRVRVEWEPGAPTWAKRFNEYFLERDRENLEYGLVRGWPSFYPAGAGSVMRRQVMERYAEEVRRGVLTSTCRCGGALSSGGDSQIIYCAVNMGMCAGLSPRLNLVHNITRSRASVRYLSRLAFGLGSDAPVVLTEAFPDLRSISTFPLPSSFFLYRRLFGLTVRNLLRLRFRKGLVTTASMLGEFDGKFRVAGATKPALLRYAARVLR